VPVVFLVFVASPCRAIVNIEDQKIEEKPGFTGEIAFSATGQSGNTEKSIVSVGTRLQWHRGTSTDIVVGNLDRGETSGVTDTDKKFLHARHISYLKERLAWEIFGQVEQDEFTRLSNRTLIGGGLRWTAYKDADERTRVTTGAGAFYSREKLEPLIGTTDAGIERLWRGNLYVSAKHRINNNLRFASTTYLQPALREFSNYQALEQLALQIKLTGALDLRLSVEVAYDSEPPQLVDNTDVTYRTGIEYSF
jgi:putative salt-induced outer membrane protein YdiY